MIDRSQFKSISDVLLSWVTVTSLILGGVWAMLEYNERQRSAITDKVSQVLIFVERYNRDPIQKYRDNKVKAFADSYRALYREKEKMEPDNHLAFQRETVDQSKIRFDIDNVTFFYDELLVCVEAGVCDSETSHSFFGKHAHDFRWGLHAYIPFVKRAREHRGVIGYAEGLVYFANAYRNRIRRGTGGDREITFRQSTFSYGAK